MCITAKSIAEWQQRVKMRKSQREHFSTAVPQKADVVLNAANGSFVPTADIQLFLTRYSGSMHRYRFSDFKAHQVLSDFQRAGIGLPRFRDEIVNRCRWHLFAGEKNEMCVDG